VSEKKLVRTMERTDLPKAAPLVAAFRVALKGYKGIRAAADVGAGEMELEEYLDAGFPAFVAEINGQLAGYLVCRVDEPCVWVESIYVAEEHRRKGVASMLYRKAENIARGFGEDTVYNYVHPNNHGMIAFLRRHGYTVLNLLEIRKPFAGEQLTRKIRVEEENFDY